MPYKDLNRHRKTYSFIRKKPDHNLLVKDNNAKSNKVFEIFENFSFVSGDISEASGSATVTFTSEHELNKNLQSMPYISIESMSTIDGETFPYVREATRAVGTDKLIIDIFFKSELNNPSNTYKISQSDLQTKIGGNTIQVQLKFSYIV